MSENGEIYTAGKNFTLPLALSALTNSTSAYMSKTNPLLPLRTKFKNLDQSSRYLAATKFESNKQKI